MVLETAGLPFYGWMIFHCVYMFLNMYMFKTNKIQPSELEDHIGFIQ